MDNPQLGNAGVVAGSLVGSFGLVAAGTVLVALGIAPSLSGTRGAARGGWLPGYRIRLDFIFLISLVGLAPSLRVH